MKKPKFFNCYLDNEVLLNHLSDEQAGKLWKSLFAFANRDETIALADPVVALAYEVMAQQINRDFAKYNEKCEKNRQNRAMTQNKTSVTNDDGRERSLTVVSVRDQEEEKEEEENEEEKEDKKENKEKEKYEEEYEEKEKEDTVKQAVECDSTTSVSLIHNFAHYLLTTKRESFRPP